MAFAMSVLFHDQMLQLKYSFGFQFTLFSMAHESRGFRKNLYSFFKHYSFPTDTVIVNSNIEIS